MLSGLVQAGPNRPGSGIINCRFETKTFELSKDIQRDPALPMLALTISRGCFRALRRAGVAASTFRLTALDRRYRRVGSQQGS